jgi:hypothetical protein
MAYGTTGGVAALTKRYTNSGAVFDATTNPTVTTVTAWLAEISAMVNIAMASSGFAVPIVDADITPALDGLVNALTADLVHAANSTGRFFSERALENGVSPIKAINKDVWGWLEVNIAGLSASGAVRVLSDAGQIAYRETDDSGTEIDPLFSRNRFGSWEGE